MVFTKTIWNTLFPGGVHFSPLGSLNYLGSVNTNLLRPREVNILDEYLIEPQVLSVHFCGTSFLLD